MRKISNGEKGITLIALIITIIILIILAGITIGAITGENGILKNTELAAIETRGASVQEARDIWFAEIYLAEITGGTAKSMDEILQDLLDEGILTQEEVDTIKTSENNEITIGSRTISFNTDYVLEKEEQIMIAELSSSNITENGFTLNVEVRDQKSGVNKIIWYYKLSTEDNYTSITDTFTATTSAITTAKEITQLSAGTYNAYAVIYDEAGNTKQTDTITVTVVEIVEVSIYYDYRSYSGNTYLYWADSFEKGPTWEEYITFATPQNTSAEESWFEIIDGYIYCLAYYSAEKNQIRSAYVYDSTGEKILASEIVESGEYYYFINMAECVFPDSEILTSKNNETILAKDIKEGDNIAYLNMDSQEIEIGKVNKVYIHKKATNFVKYTFEDGTYIEVTDYHPIYTKQAWKSYTQRNGYDIPQIGDEVKTPTNWKKITKIEAWTGEEDCYDFAIINEKGETINNYFANGTLVQGSY